MVAMAYAFDRADEAAHAAGSPVVDMEGLARSV
jgi:hypothetical protein